MAEIVEVNLPGVGVRHEFTSSRGEPVAVVTHRSGRREILISRVDDPDACAPALDLNEDDAAALGTILGAPQVAAAAAAMQRLEGLALDWLTVGAGGAGRTIAEGAFRTRTGSPLVAVVRDSETLPAPGPTFRLEERDVVVAVGTEQGLAQLRELLL